MAVLYNGGLGGGYLAGNPINGTEKIGANFGLGGTLTKKTIINASGKDFDFYQDIDGNLQTLHIGKTGGGLLDFVGEHIEDLPNDTFLLNGVADLTPFSGEALTAIVGYFDFTNSYQCILVVNKDATDISYQNSTVSVVSRVDSNNVEHYFQDLANNTISSVLVSNLSVKLESEDNLNAKGANIDVNKDGSILSSFTSHLVIEGVGTTDKNFGYSAFTDRFTGAAADSATMYRYDQAIGLDERVFGINNDNLWASFLYDVSDNQNYSLLGFTAGSGFSRLYWGAEVTAGSTDLANATYFEAGPNGLKLKGAIMSDQVETVAPTAIPGTYTKRIAIKDLNNNLLGYMPIL